MDDPPVNGQGRGRMASLVVVGLVLGLAAGWIVWRGEPGPTGEVPGPPVRTSPSPETVVEGVDVTNDPTLGPADAPVTIVEFSDFECPFCTRFANRTAPALRRQYGDRIRWIFVNNPLRSIHPDAYDAALAGECAAAQDRFWDFYDAMFAGGTDASDPAVRSAAGKIGLDMEEFEACWRDARYAEELAADMREAQKFYILGTPTFFINGRRLEGAQPPEAFAAVIDSILASEG
ncbi:MAG: thioredoxin domain-containing protein [Gemmatimonadota bacterium]|nr:thioredoxin domain-containing protein [Gemmatimonadota bacterium]